MRSFLDPRLKANLQDFYPSVCTILTKDRTQNESSGQWQDGTLAPVAGLSNLSCRIGPLILIRPTDTEERTSKDTAVLKTRQLKINGYFPQIDVTTMCVRVDGITYSILGEEEDGSQLTTRLRLQIIEPGVNT